MEFHKGEGVEWTIADKGHLILSRKIVPPHPVPVKNSTLLEELASHD